MRHAEVLESLQSSRRVPTALEAELLDDQIAEAIYFFKRVTGISPDAEPVSLVTGYLPGESFSRDVKRLEEWFDSHRDRLIWNEAVGRVEVGDVAMEVGRPPTCERPPIRQEWEFYLETAKSHRGPRSETDYDLRDAVWLFIRLAGESPSYGLDEARILRDLQRLEDWYSENHHRLTRDEVGRVVVRPSE